MKRLTDYREIVGDDMLGKIFQNARKLYGKQIIHINATYLGGGVAEMLHSLVPLMNSVGIATDWRILHPNRDLFNITKKFHNALQGDPINLSNIMKKYYLQANEEFFSYAVIDQDCVIIHDPQPLPLIRFYNKQQPWLWRCHIDLSNPDENLWHYLKGFILMYDKVVVSHEKYKKSDLPLDQKVIHPVIDPLTPKNMAINDKLISKYLKKFGISTEKPIITQISRFDKWKDPIGVLEVFKNVKRKIDCRLVLCGSMASDDPEGIKIYMKVRQRANRLIEKGDVVLITSEDSILVNALQRISAVILQKSLKEGFGLTVTEAMWKQKSVVASNVGGLPLQIKDGENGFLVEPTDNNGFEERIIEILKNPNLAAQTGQRAKESVGRNFLITRLLLDYLNLLNEVL